MHLYLLRHGQANTNVRRLVTGTPDDALTDEGRRQAAAAATLLDGLAFEAVYTSHWRRASETGALAWPQGGFVVEERLGEIGGGDVADMPLAEFIARHPDFMPPWDPCRRFPGGESPADVYERATAWLKETASRFAPEARVLAVCHLGVISCLLQYIFSVPMRLFPRFNPPNASLSCLAVPQACEPDQCRLLFYGLTPDMVSKVSISA